MALSQMWCEAPFSKWHLLAVPLVYDHSQAVKPDDMNLKVGNEETLALHTCLYFRVRLTTCFSRFRAVSNIDRKSYFPHQKSRSWWYRAKIKRDTGDKEANKTGKPFLFYCFRVWFFEVRRHSLNKESLFPESVHLFRVIGINKTWHQHLTSRLHSSSVSSSALFPATMSQTMIDSLLMFLPDPRSMQA